MSRTPDPIGEGIELPDLGEDPVNVGDIRNNAGQLKAKDSTGIFNLRSGSGITAPTHRALDQLVHEIAEASYDQIVYTGNRVDAVVTWTSPAMTTKIREELYTYSGNQVTQIVTKQYDGSGVLISGETMTEVPSYTGNRVDDITRTVT